MLTAMTGHGVIPILFCVIRYAAMGDGSIMWFRTFRACVLGLVALCLPIAGAPPVAADAFTYSVTFNGQYGAASGNPVQGEAVVWGSLNTPIAITVKVSSSLPARVVFLPVTPLNTPPDPLPSGVRFVVTGAGCQYIGAPQFWDQAYGCDIPAGTHSVTATYTVASSSPITGSRVPWPLFSASLYTGTNGDEHPGGSCEIKWAGTHPGPGSPTTNKPTSAPAAKHATGTTSPIPTTMPTSPTMTASPQLTTQPTAELVVTSADASPASAPITSDATLAPAAVAQSKSGGGGSSAATLIAALVLAGALGAGLTAFLRLRRRSAASPDHETAP